MRNHFHLRIETPQPNLAADMKWLFGVYSKRFNIRHKTCGQIFDERYESLIVDGSKGYLQTVCDYVDLNAVRAEILKPRQPLESFLWSSSPAYFQPSSERPGWLRVRRRLERVLKIPRAVLRRGRAAGFVAPRFDFPSPASQLPHRMIASRKVVRFAPEYAPSSRLAIHPAALAIPLGSIFKTRS